MKVNRPCAWCVFASFTLVAVHLINVSFQLSIVDRAFKMILMPAAMDQEDASTSDGSTTQIILQESSGGTPIPHCLTFTYAKNLLDPMYLQSLDADGIYARNVNRTIRKFVEAWETETMVVDVDDREGDNETSRENKASNFSLQQYNITFLTDEDCIGLINKTEPRLFLPFVTEATNAHKADICRVVALWHTGGYYMDIDLLVHEVPRLPSRTEFSTILESSLLRFHQGFIAVTPKHPVMNLSMHIMVEFYEGRQPALHHVNMGTWTMREAYNRWIKEFPQKAESVYLLQEQLLLNQPYLFPEVERVKDVPMSNYVVVDIKKNSLVFWVRCASLSLQMRYGLALPPNNPTSYQTQ